MKEESYIDEGCFILELSNTPEDPAVSIARARVPPGVTTRWHRLLPQDVGPGDVVLIPPSCRRRIANIGQSDLIFLAICTPRFVQDAYRDG